MSKYVIDTTLDNVKKVIAMGVTKGGAIWTDTTDIENLEELNSDYINEHFSDLQDTAYQRGLENGKQATFALVADASNAEYQRGLNDAWECARKLFSSMAESDIEKAFPIEWNNGGFNALINLQPQEAIEKLKAYEEKQDDKPIIGEVVERYLNGKRDGVGMFLGEDCDYWNCLFWTGAIFGTFAYPSNQFKRTGNVCDIEKILEAMKA